MNVTFGYKAMPIHADFHRSTAKHRMLFGAMGSGKTYAIIAEVIAWCLEQPGIRGMVVRKTYQELSDTTEPIFQELIPADLWRASHISHKGGHLNEFIFPNGSTVMFRSLDDWNKQRSQNLGFVAYDECNELDQESYDGMRSRVRQIDLTAEARDAGYTAPITRRGTWGATNPEGKDWLWDIYHADSPNRRPGYEMFTSTTLDNPYLPPDFVADMLTYPKPWIARYVLCQFDDFAGHIYESWSYDDHVVKLPVFTKEEQRANVYWMGMDPGTENPTAGLWVWCDRENRRLVGVAEYQEAGLAADVHAAAWRELEIRQHMNVRWRVADPNSVTQRDRGTAISLQTQYAKLGYNFNLGASKERDRIPALGRLIELRRFVLTDNCPRTFDAIKEYRWKDLTPQQRSSGEDPRETPLKKNTHLVECAQYIAGREVPIPKLNMYADMSQNQAFNADIHRILKKNRQRARQPKSHDLGTIRV